jgi:methyltransferase (TIGR00027 family)
MAVKRHDKDTWDLATGVGSTATMVAAGRARASIADHPLIRDEFAEPLVRAVGIEFYTRWATGELNASDVDIDGAPWGMQKMTDMVTARTRHFDEFTAEATDAGIGQVVILASGLDARGYRLPWPKGTVVFEIDQPAVLSFKFATLAEHNAQPTTDLRAVSVDLREDWPTALREAGFDPARPSAWLAEGLLPYLAGDAQDRLLDDITELSSAHSRVAIELASDQTQDFADRHDAQAIEQRWRNHGYDVEHTDLTFPGERRDVVSYLDSRGWQPSRHTLHDLLTQAGLSAAGGLLGEPQYCTALRTAQ